MVIISQQAIGTAMGQAMVRKMEADALYLVFSTRVRNLLLKHGITSLSKLEHMSFIGLCSLSGFGPKAQEEVRAWRKGMRLARG